MKNLRSILSALAVLLMATAVHAQQTKVSAIVPFNFVVGDAAYPAGEYKFGSTASSALLRIDDTEREAGSFVLSHICGGGEPSTKTKLVFQRMGGEYFLYQVWIEGNADGRQLPISRTEMRLAKNHEKSELVIVAANITK